jgi:alpha-tubulin suppressor-like RCC1 family protein
MIRGGILNSRARGARRAAPAVARAVAGAAAAAVGGLAVSLAAAALPALAAQHAGGPVAGQVRAGTTRQHMSTSRMSPGAPWTQITAGAFHTCGIHSGGTLWCWGDNLFGQLGTARYAGEDRPHQVTIPAPGGWASVTAGYGHTCATRTDGTLWCWGQNYFGQLGIGNYTSHNRPEQVTTPAPGGWAAVTAGSEHTCATRTDGTLWCWGFNLDGELGIGNNTDQDLPQRLTTPAPGGWAAVSAGVYETCATRTGGTLWCWGFDLDGELGVGSSLVQELPLQVTTPAPGGWAAVSAGDSRTCATRTGGTLWCWGNNDNGQLGIGSHTDQGLPRQVTTPAPGGWTSVAPGYGHTCAIRTGGTLWCWGDNFYGELGTGSHAAPDLPRQVTTPAPDGWATVTAGSDHTCATRTGGVLWCWGYNEYGQLGIGSHTDQDRPRQVTGCGQPGTQPRPAGSSSTVTHIAE